MSSGERLVVDRYELHEPIARGGMATVHFACRRGAAGFATAVAVKRMRPELAHEREFVDMFLDEARLASRVRHANVVGVIDVVSSDGELLLVMDYVHGEALGKLWSDARREGRRMPPAVAVAIVVDVLHGLHAAHEATDEQGATLGIVHRDVSPANVLVGADGVARVADFGIAKAEVQIHSTAEGKTRGKLRYMSPEQLRGKGLDRRADVYSASVVLWELLTGSSLFDAEDIGGLHGAVLSQPIESPGVLVPELPEALDAVVLTGLAREPNKRYATALDMSKALERALTPASRTEVGAWVKANAGDALDARARIVRAMESNAQRAPEAAVVAEQGTGTHDATTMPLVREPKRIRARWVVGLLVASGALALAGWLSAAKPTPNISVRSAAPAARSTDMSTGPAGTLVNTSPGAAPAARSTDMSTGPSGTLVTSTSTPTPTSTSTSTSTSTPTPTSTLTSTATATATASTRKKVNGKDAGKCDPPYDVDSAGRQWFKVECL